ncbi:uncharacterized protein TNCV_4730261 [Trichonephila clavipes]|nr:uncharacterized protein TNCV_4730261 [Trichonephila clavipes]
MSHQREKTVESVPLDKAKSESDSGSADGSIQCRSRYKCLRTHSSVGTIGYGTEQQTSQSWASVDQTSLPTTPRDQLHLYMVSVSELEIGFFQQDSVSSENAKIVLEGFEEHKDEFL